jgi:hypothetical protein
MEWISAHSLRAVAQKSFGFDKTLTGSWSKRSDSCWIIAIA